MFSFKQFIIEVQRDVGRATKLANYLAKRRPAPRWDGSHAMLSGDIRVKAQIPPGVVQRALRKHYAAVDNKQNSPYKTTEEHIPIKHISPTQSYVHRRNLDYPIQNKEHPPTLIMRHKGKHWLVDGHHRYMAEKIKGGTHLHSQILHVPDDEGSHDPQYKQDLKKPSIFSRIKKHFTET